MHAQPFEYSPLLPPRGYLVHREPTLDCCHPSPHHHGARWDCIKCGPTRRCSQSRLCILDIPVPDEFTMFVCSYHVSIVNSSGTGKSRMVHGGPSSLCCAHLSEQKKIPWFDLPPSVWVTWMFRSSTVYPPLDESLLLIYHESYCILSSRM